MTLPMSLGDEAPVSATASPTMASQLLVGELLGQVALDDLGLALLGLGELVAAGLAVGLGGLEPALALALEHGDLVAAAPSFSAFCSSLTIRRRACTRSRSPALRAVVHVRPAPVRAATPPSSLGVLRAASARPAAPWAPAEAALGDRPLGRAADGAATCHPHQVERYVERSCAPPARGEEPMTLDPVATFDVYGTLIDWEGGAASFLYELASRQQARPPRAGAA